ARHALARHRLRGVRPPLRRHRRSRGGPLFGVHRRRLRGLRRDRLHRQRLPHRHRRHRARLGLGLFRGGTTAQGDLSMSTVTSQDGTTIAYTVSGQGPAVILVDGAMCYRDSGPAGPLAERLAANYTVYIYDRRGRGESGDTQPYAVEREVEDLDALIHEAGGTAYLYGISS